MIGDDDSSDKHVPQGGEEQELDSRSIKIQQKRFYIDVKQNARGRFIKIAEVVSHERKSRLLLSMSTAHEFKNHLTQFNDLYVTLGPQNPESAPNDGKFKTVVMTKDNRRYYLDLKENDRGRFLRVSQTINFASGPRYQIRIPAQGMIEFRDALTELLDQYSTEEDQINLSNHSAVKKELPEGQHFRTENKKFYFDIGQNNFGVFMRISEVKLTYRTSITIPESSWARFRDILNDYCEKSEIASNDKNKIKDNDEGTSSKDNKN